MGASGRSRSRCEFTRSSLFFPRDQALNSYFITERNMISARFSNTVASAHTHPPHDPPGAKHTVIPPRHVERASLRPLPPCKKRPSGFVDAHVSSECAEWLPAHAICPRRSRWLLSHRARTGVGHRVRPPPSPPPHLHPHPTRAARAGAHSGGSCGGLAAVAA